MPGEREALKPLPEKGGKFTYQEMYTRARLQAMAAVEAFYIDGWLELEQTAQVLEQSARYLPRSSEPPAHLKVSLEKDADQLRKQAVRLGEAARAKNDKTANEVIQQIQMTIRTLRPEE